MPLDYATDAKTLRTALDVVCINFILFLFLFYNIICLYVHLYVKPFLLVLLQHVKRCVTFCRSSKFIIC